MAQYSVLKDEDIRDILNQYGVTDLISYSVLSGGSENTNYLTSTEQGELVLTISEQKSMKEAKNLARLLEYLSGQGFPSSKIIRNSNNEAISVYNGKPVMLKHYIDGKIMSDLPAHLLELLGKTVGKLHKIEALDFLPDLFWCSIERFDEIEKYDLNSSFHLWLKGIRSYIENYITPELPKAFIHCDVFDNNVVVSKDESDAIIMDFEEASYYYRVFDIGMMIIGLCSKEGAIDLKKVGHILKGYQSENKLLEKELKALQAFTVYAAAGVAFWRHKQFNYTYPDPKLFNHFKIMKDLADHIKGIPESTFLAHLTELK